MITPELVEELVTWLFDPYFLDCSRKFSEIHEKDIKLYYGLFNLVRILYKLFFRSLHAWKPLWVYDW